MLCEPANGTRLGAQEDAGDVMADAGNGGASVPASSQFGICAFVVKVLGEAIGFELTAKEIASVKCGCVYIVLVPAHEAEKENGLKGETSPDDECDSLVPRYVVGWRDSAAGG